MANGGCSRQKQGKKGGEAGRWEGDRKTCPDRIRAPHSTPPDPHKAAGEEVGGGGTGPGSLPEAAQRCRNDTAYRLGHHLLVPETLSPLWKGKKIPLPFFFLSLCTETSFILDPNPLPLPPVSTGKVIVPPPPCNLEGYEIVTIV